MLAVPRIWDCQCPIVSVVANSADDLVFRNDLEHTSQIAHKPVLAGNGAGVARGLVLVVVHQDNSIGVRGNGLEIGVGSGYSGVHVKAQLQRLKIPIELVDEGEVCGSGLVGQALKVEREAAIGGERRKESHDLPTQCCPFRRIRQNIAKA